MVMIANFKLIWLNIFVRLRIWANGRFLDIFNNYDGLAYLNIK